MIYCLVGQWSEEWSDIIAPSELVLKFITSHYGEPDLLLTHLMGSGQMG